YAHPAALPSSPPRRSSDLHNGIPVAVFRGVLHLHIEATKFLDEVFAQQTCVPARTTGHDDDAVGLTQFIGNIIQAAQRNMTLVGIEPATQRVADGRGLFMDFLQHEMVEVALLYRGQ